MSVRVLCRGGGIASSEDRNAPCTHPPPSLMLVDADGSLCESKIFTSQAVVMLL